MIKSINWYPGHMKKTVDMIKDNLKAVDIVIELVDARIPESSRNPLIDDLAGNKDRIIVLNKADLADAYKTQFWIDFFQNKGIDAVGIDSLTGAGIERLYSILDEYRKKTNNDKRYRRAVRMIIVGVPNVGKSSFINRLAGRRSTRTGNKPGVTRGKQWISLNNGMQLLDTPGILWPKIEERQVSLNLAFCGNIKDEIMDAQDLAFELIKILGNTYPEELRVRYSLHDVAENPIVNMDNIAKMRGFLMHGGKVDYERTGRTVIREFRSGTIGRITLEIPKKNIGASV